MNFYSIKHTLRYSNKNRSFSLINLAGLILGISSSLLIYAFVSFELSFDSFHQDGDRIYRVLGVDEAIGVSNNQVGIVMAPLAPAMESEISQVEDTVRIQGQGRSLITVENESYYTQFMISAEPSLFEMFDFELRQGIAGQVLSEPDTAVITEEYAQVLFGDTDPMGKVLRVNNNQDVQIVGIMADVAANSHLQFDLITSFRLSSNATEQQVQGRENWGFINTSIYTKLARGSSETEVEQQLSALITERGAMSSFGATLEPLFDAHLDSTTTLFDGQNNQKGNADQVFILATVAVFILLIAAFNFMNLSTARSSTRAKEVGVRKVNGASRLQLGAQFMLDSLVYVFVASLISVALVLTFGPMINFPVDINFAEQLFPDVSAIVLLISGLALLAVLAGSYPAFVLSGLPMMNVLKESSQSSGRGKLLRWCLVVVQFGISVGIIIGMFVVSDQLTFMKNKDIGFERNGIVNIRLGDRILRDSFEELKNELEAIPEIQSLATSSNMPGLGYGRTGIQPEGGDPDDQYVVSTVNIDANYLDTLEMRVIEGRGYSDDIASDETEALIVNQAVLDALGWDTGLGRTISTFGGDRTVIGVLENFHFTNLRHEIEPLVMNFSPGSNSFLSLKIGSADVSSALGKIEAVWREINPEHPFEYTFFNEDFENLFSDDEEFSVMLFQFTFIAIIVACLGLYGLASFSADQKTKQIGIRKVLGAPSLSISLLVMKEYVILILIANALAWPVMWLVLNTWLNGFVYRIELSLLSFLMATVLTTIIAMATVSREIYRIVANNPVKALRYE